MKVLISRVDFASKCDMCSLKFQSVALVTILLINAFTKLRKITFLTQISENRLTNPKKEGNDEWNTWQRRELASAWKGRKWEKTRPTTTPVSLKYL